MYTRRPQPLAKANGKRPVGRPRTGWTNYTKGLQCDHLELYPSKVMDVMENREVSRLYLKLLLPQLSRKVGDEEIRRLFFAEYCFVAISCCFLLPIKALQNNIKVFVWKCLKTCQWRRRKISILNSKFLSPFSSIVVKFASHSLQNRLDSKNFRFFSLLSLNLQDSEM